METCLPQLSLYSFRSRTAVQIRTVETRQSPLRDYSNMGPRDFHGNERADELISRNPTGKSRPNWEVRGRNL